MMPYSLQTHKQPTALILDANEKACTSLGYTREELLSMKVIDFEMKIQDIDSWKDHVDKIMIDNCQIINEGVYKRKDGTTFPIEVNTKLVTQNEKDYLVAVIRDITERKQVEEALWESNEKYRSLTDDVLDSSAVGIFILDSYLRVVWVNHALEDYFGLKKNEIIGKDKRRLIRERIKDIFEDPDSFANKVFNTYDDNTYVEHFECHVLPNDERKERWLEHRSKPIQSGLYAGGRIEHYYDITERKQAEKEIINTKNYLDMIVSMSHDGIMVVDSEGKIEFANNACCEMSGYIKEEIINKPVLETIDPKYTEFMMNRWNEVQAGECGTYETVMVKKDGTRNVAIIKDVSIDITEYINAIAETLKD
jgi:PAS domain S-box-containing protein